MGAPGIGGVLPPNPAAPAPARFAPMPPSPAPPPGYFASHVRSSPSNDGVAVRSARFRSDRQAMAARFGRSAASTAAKLADVGPHFTGGELDGLKLIGFAIWERRDGKGRNITFPARQFTVGGDRRSFSLSRYVDNPVTQDRLRDFLLQAYQAHEQEAEQAATS